MGTLIEVKDGAVVWRYTGRENVGEREWKNGTEIEIRDSNANFH